MPEPFVFNVDVANRALQHLGATRITSFTDASRNAAAVSFCYDKLRVAELRRNVWRFATRKVVLRAIQTSLYPLQTITTPVPEPSMLFVPGAYDPTKTYIVGSVVSYQGIYYQASDFVALNTAPGTGDPWAQYFGNLVAQAWDTTGATPAAWNSGTTYAANQTVLGSDNQVYSSLINGNLNHNPVGDGNVHWLDVGPPAATGTAYFAGEVVYTPVGASPGVYLSLQNGNSDTPTIVSAWSATIPYQKGATVLYSSVVYQSTEDLNVNNTPTGSGPWVTVPVTQPDQMQGLNWIKLGAATLKSLSFVYPIGTGPVSDSVTRNVFMLPFGFLREAPADPKQGSTSYLGAPSGGLYNDWNFEGNFITSTDPGPLTLRFVADIADVTEMDPMFCEGLAARIATETCEEITQSDAKLGAVGAQYKEFMTEARVVNGIETGSTEPPLDDWIACRM